MFENYSSFYTQAPIFEAHYLLDHWLQFHGQMKPISFFFMTNEAEIKSEVKVSSLYFTVFRCNFWIWREQEAIRDRKGFRRAKSII